MPDNPIAGLYPQSPQPQGGILGQNPLYAVGLLSQINANQRFQQEFAAQKAVGNAFQSALNPDGTIDTGKLTAGLQNPAAAYAAPGAINDMLAQRGQQISNSRAQFELGSAQNNYAGGRLSALAAKANTPGGITDSDIFSTVADLSRGTNIPSSVLTGWTAGIPQDQPGRKTYFANLANSMTGPAAATTRVNTITPEGAGATIPQGQPLYNGGAVPTSLPPGVSDALAANRAEYVGDQSKSAQIMANVRPLQQALPLIENLSNSNFGPGSPEFAKIKGALTTAGIIDPSTSDLQVRQEVGKYLLKYAQGAQNAGRSDQALSAAIGSNPNLDLTQPANLSLIKAQIGMDRMDAALPLASKLPAPLGNGGDSSKYKDFKSGYYQSMDPRAFSFDLMSPEERRQVIDSLGKPGTAAYKKFSDSYQIAKHVGLVTPQQQQQPANGQ